MGWICRACGSENDFSSARCLACDAVVSQSFIRLEQARAKRELSRYQSQKKRRHSVRRVTFRKLRRLNRTVCRSMAVLVLVSTLYSVVSAQHLPDALRIGASCAVSAAERSIGRMGENAAAQLDAAASLISGRMLSLSLRQTAVAGRIARLTHAASEKIGMTKQLQRAMDGAGERVAARMRQLGFYRTQAMLRIKKLQTRVSAVDSPETLWHMTARMLRNFLQD